MVIQGTSFITQNLSTKIGTLAVPTTGSAPTFPTGGLTLYFDPGNITSYPGSGSNWYDLSGRNDTGTLYNNYSYTGSKGGAMNFKPGYVSDFPLPMDGNSSTGSHTAIMFFQTQDITAGSRRGLFGTREAGWVLTTNRTNAGGLDYYHTGGSSLAANTNIQKGVWTQAGVVYNATAQTAKIIVNNINVASQGSFAVASAGTNGLVGEESTGLSYPFTGSMGVTLIYNRPLSDVELTSVYDYFKERYGLV